MINKKHFCQLLLIIILIFAAQMNSFATDGDGEGGGQNQDDPLTLETCNIQDGQSGVPVDTTIKLEFNKNVVNMTVAENNKKCFSLTDAAGQSVPIEIQMGDDQVDPTIKRTVTVAPADSLGRGSFYTLTINGEFRAKNGTELGIPVVISFRTAGADTDSERKAAASEDTGTAITGSGITSGSGISQATPGSVDAMTDSENQENRKTEKRTEPWLIFSVLCFSAAAVLVTVFIFRRIKK